MNVTPLRRRRDGVIAPYHYGDKRQTFRPAYVRFTVVSSFFLSFPVCDLRLLLRHCGREFRIVAR